MIDVDHMSERARDARARDRGAARLPARFEPHGDRGELDPGRASQPATGSGGIAAATPAQAPELAERILALRAYDRGRETAGVAFGSDTGGFSSLPGPPEAGHEVAYPFDGYRSDVEFHRQVSGERAFDLNFDGVAHYGLFADLLATMRSEPGGAAATRTLYGSAEAYLQSWSAARELPAGRLRRNDGGRWVAPVGDPRIAPRFVGVTGDRTRRPPAMRFSPPGTSGSRGS